MLATKSTNLEKISKIFKSVKNFYTVEQLEGYLLAGRGNAYYQENDDGTEKLMCGGFSALIGCETHYKTQNKILKHSCDRMECPICYQNWASKRAEASTIRMLRIYETYKRNGINLGKPKHVIFSPISDTFLHLLKCKGFSYARKEVYKVLRRAGLIGGQLVFHLWRKNKTEKHWYLSPHFHVVGWGFLINTDKFVKLFPSWKIKNLKGRTYPTDIKKLKHNALYETIRYEYTHACKAVGTNSHVMTWFGCASYNKLIKTEIIERETIDCKICSEPFVNIKRTRDAWSNDLKYKIKFVIFRIISGQIEWFEEPQFGNTFFIKKIDYYFELKGPPDKSLKKSYEKIFPTFQDWKKAKKLAAVI